MLELGERRLNASKVQGMRVLVHVPVTIGACAARVEHQHRYIDRPLPRRANETFVKQSASTVGTVIPFRTLSQASSPFSIAGENATAGDAESRQARRGPGRSDLGWIVVVLLELGAVVAVMLVAGGSH